MIWNDHVYIYIYIIYYIYILYIICKELALFPASPKYNGRISTLKTNPARRTIQRHLQLGAPVEPKYFSARDTSSEGLTGCHFGSTFHVIICTYIYIIIYISYYKLLVLSCHVLFLGFLWIFILGEKSKQKPVVSARHPMLDTLPATMSVIDCSTSGPCWNFGTFICQHKD